MIKFLFLVLFGAHAFAQTPYVEPTRVLRSKGYQVGVFADSFTTTSFVDDEGETQSLRDGYSFNRLQAEIEGLYGLTHDLQIGVGFRFRQNAAVNEDSGEKLTASSSGLESTFVNLKYAFSKVNNLQYTLEGAFRYRAYSNQEYDSVTDDPNILVLGDTGNETSAGLGVTYLSKNRNFATVRGGYMIPGVDLSHEFYWQIEGAMVWSNVALVAGVNGITSIQNDPYESTPENRPNLNAQTYLYNSSNRELIAPYGGINFALGNAWRIELRGSQVISGNSTDLGTVLGINLIRRTEPANTRTLDNKFKTYDIEAAVTKVSPKKEYLEIDKGIADDINKGMRIDFFAFDYVGGNVLVASGIVVKTKSDSAIVKITQRFNTKTELKEGLIGRATVK